MPRLPPRRPITRVPARPAQPTPPAKPDLRGGPAAPSDSTEIVAEKFADARDALAADGRFATLTAAQLLSQLQVQRVGVAKGFYAMGLLLRELARPERYQVELGYETFDDLLEQKYVINRMTAVKYIAVATFFDEKIATELGIEKTYALVKYAAATGKREDAPLLVETNPEVGEEHEHLLDLTARDILRAAQDLKANKAAQNPSQVEHATRRLARQVQAWIRKAGAKKAVARARRHEGKWGVSIRLENDEAERIVGI